MNSNLFLQYFKEIKENPTNLQRNILSRLDFSEIYDAPHLIPKEYSEGFPLFFENSIKSIEIHLDAFWCYIESLGTKHEYVCMESIGDPYEVVLIFSYIY